MTFISLDSDLGATGSATPANATMVGGTDGTNLRALSTDATGRLVLDVSRAVATATPPSALQVGGTDGTNLRALLTAASPFFNDAVTTVVQVKATAGVFSAFSLVNTTAAAAYLQIFFAPSAGVVLGTTVADLVIRLNASASIQLPFPAPIGYGGTGLSVAGTTTPTGAVAAAISVSATYA